MMNKVEQPTCPHGFPLQLRAECPVCGKLMKEEKQTRLDSAPEEPRQTIQQIKQRLLDPRAISEKHDREGRQATAMEIARVRQESQSLRASITGRENTLGEIERQAATLNSLRAEKLLALEQRTEKAIVRLKSILGIGDKIASEIGETASSLEAEIDGIYRQTVEAQNELKQLKQGQAAVPDSRKLLESYYEKMETVPLTNEEKREMLTPEVLADLSTEEYIALWRRLNPHFLSHVTRQGFRDHNAMIWHSGGLQEFHNGLVGVLEDGKILRPPLAVHGLRTRDEASIRRFVEGWVLEPDNEDDAKQRLKDKLNNSLATAPNYPDKTAVHFAAQIAADRYYGGESSNEAFFLYPSDVLASQHNYAFNGSEKDFTKPQSETMWNDVFVWPQTLDNPGIPVDSGVVFLPENMHVDPETGSKYASEIKLVEGEEKRVMIEDEKLVSAFLEWSTKLTDSSPAVLAYKAWIGERNYWKQDEVRKTCSDVLRQEMLNLGFVDEAATRLMETILSNDGMGAFVSSGKLDWGDSTPKEAAMFKLRQASANWKRPRNAISSKEFWERYFTQNPQQKPKHIIYYDGDPTSAIYKFQQKNNIGSADVSDTEGKLLGFDDRHITDMHKDPRAYAGYDELVEMGNKIIAEHYRHT